MKRTNLLVTVVVALLLVAVVSSAALAADQPIAIQLDGNNIAVGDVAPVLVEGRTFIPFRVLFEAMGATVSYDDASRTVSAERDGVAISFVVGKKEVSIVNGETKDTVETDAASFVSNGRTLVPVRFAAQALGCSVGWDSANRTVLIADSEKLLKNYAGKFTVMEMLLVDNAKYNTKNYAFSGSMKMDIKVTDDGKVYPIVADVTFDGLVNGLAAMEMNALINMSMDELLKTSTDDAEALKAAAESLKNIDCKYIIDLKAGVYYFSSDKLAAMLGQEAGTWFSVDINKIMEEMDMAAAGGEAFAGMNLTDLMAYSQITSFDQVLDLVLQMSALTDVNSYKELVNELNLIENILGDKAFSKTGNVYTAKSSFTEDDASIALAITINAPKQVVASYEITVAVSQKDVAELNLTTAMSATEKETIKGSIKIAGLMDCTLDAQMQYSDTNKTAATKPANAKVVDLMEVLATAIANTTAAGTAE